MKIEDINALTELTNLHIRLSDAIALANDKTPLLNIQGKVVEVMQKIVNPLQDAKCVGGLPPYIDPNKVKTETYPQEDKPARRRTRGLGIR